MILHSISLRDFRNIEAADIVFSKDTTVLLGENAAGKTNAVEAIYIFSRGRGFRSSGDSELVRFGCGGYFAEMEFERGGRKIKLSQNYREDVGGRRKRRLKNGARITAAELIGQFNAVLFTPDHLSILRGAPAERRSFIDAAISTVDRIYFERLCRYDKLSSERAALLRAAHEGEMIDRSLLSVYGSQMATLAAAIHVARREYITELSSIAADFDESLSDGREILSIGYINDAATPDEEPSEEELRSQYERLFSENLTREIGAGRNLFGVGRDDLAVDINGRTTRDFGSQGQIRSAVLSLKLAEGELAYRRTGERPIYLLDDVLSELDSRRRDFFFRGCTGQTVITSCERMPESAYVGADGERVVKIYSVAGGKFEELS